MQPRPVRQQPNHRPGIGGAADPFFQRRAVSHHRLPVRPDADAGDKGLAVAGDGRCRQPRAFSGEKARHDLPGKSFRIGGIAQFPGHKIDGSGGVDAQRFCQTRSRHRRDNQTQRAVSTGYADQVGLRKNFEPPVMFGPAQPDPGSACLKRAREDIQAEFVKCTRRGIVNQLDQHRTAMGPVRPVRQ